MPSLPFRWRCQYGPRGPGDGPAKPMPASYPPHPRAGTHSTGNDLPNQGPSSKAVSTTCGMSPTDATTFDLEIDKKGKCWMDNYKKYIRYILICHYCVFAYLKNSVAFCIPACFPLFYVINKHTLALKLYHLLNYCMGLYLCFHMRWSAKCLDDNFMVPLKSNHCSKAHGCTMKGDSKRRPV